MTAETILQYLSVRGIRAWVETDKIKLDAPRGSLTADDLIVIQQHKVGLLAALTPKPGTCPQCRQGMKLQDRAGDAWWCPACRIWADSKGQPLPPVVKTRPVCREEVEARKLLADLQTAGCGIYLNGDEVRITNLTKIPSALWLKLMDADTDFLRIARQMAESFEPRSDYIN